MHRNAPYAIELFNFEEKYRGVVLEGVVVHSFQTPHVFAFLKDTQLWNLDLNCNLNNMKVEIVWKKKRYGPFMVLTLMKHIKMKLAYGFLCLYASIDSTWKLPPKLDSFEEHAVIFANKTSHHGSKSFEKPNHGAQTEARAHMRTTSEPSGGSKHVSLNQKIEALPFEQIRHIFPFFFPHDWSEI